MGEMHGVGNATPAQIMAAMSMAKKFRMGLVMATTADYQEPTETKLKQLGFKCFKKFLNPNSNRTVKVWFKSTKDANVKGTAGHSFRPPLVANYLDGRAFG